MSFITNICKDNTYYILAVLKSSNCVLLSSGSIIGIKVPFPKFVSAGSR